MKYLTAAIISWLFAPVVEWQRLRALRLAKTHFQQLQLIQDNLRQINHSNILVFATMFNEAHLLPAYLEHYRRLGVNHFIFIDNDSTDKSLDLLTGCEDVSVFQTHNSYKQANFGMHWVNALLRKYGCGHWCLVCDLDELLIFENGSYQSSPTTNNPTPLTALTQRLDNGQQESFYTMMLDMYPRQIDERRQPSPAGAKELLASAPYFDKRGYQWRFNKKYRSQMVRGGVRQRLLYSHDPDKAPALQKIPLVKWQASYAYLSSMHTLAPRRLNLSFQAPETGALLHFKFAPGFAAKVSQESVRQQHYDNSSEYQCYQALNDATAMFDDGVSIRFESARQLADLGLIRAVHQVSDEPTPATYAQIKTRTDADGPKVTDNG
ncbi:glycosyltransferase family 2 protein [Thalassotalea mangrovi]|nr:glycosyltransferase family 2 protein [Thalassotalea mangrovi]